MYPGAVLPLGFRSPLSGHLRRLQPRKCRLRPVTRRRHSERSRKTSASAPTDEKACKAAKRDGVKPRTSTMFSTPHPLAHLRPRITFHPPPPPLLQTQSRTPLYVLFLRSTHAHKPSRCLAKTGSASLGRRTGLASFGTSTAGFAFWPCSNRMFSRVSGTTQTSRNTSRAAPTTRYGGWVWDVGLGLGLGPASQR